MSREFDSASSEYLEVNSAPSGTHPPITMACWVYVNDVDNNYGPMFFGDKDDEDMLYSFLLRGAIDDTPYFFVRENSAVFVAATTTFSANTWHHLCGTSNPTGTAHQMFLDGGNKGTSSTSALPTGKDRVAIGAFRDSTPGGYLDGKVAEAAIWSAVLTDDEVAILAKGFSPLLVRPDKLTFYMPLIRDDDKDIVGGLSLAAGGTPTVADHPRIFRPAPKGLYGVPSAAPTVRRVMLDDMLITVGA